MVKILHVEDSRIAHTVVTKLFMEKGLEYAVEWAATVSEAMKMLGEKQYDLLLLDYLLPDGTGIDLLEKAKDTPVVFFTGKGSERIAAQVIKQGAYDYVVKDLDGAYMEILPSVIERALQVARLKREKEETEKKLRESRESLDEEERLNKILLKREFRIKELMDENEKLKAEIERLKKRDY